MDPLVYSKGPRNYASTKKAATVLLIFVLAVNLFNMEFLRQQSCRHDPQTMSQKKKTTTAHVIPHRLTFNFHTNLWKTELSELDRSNRMFARNVNHTVNMFREAWNATLQNDGNVKAGMEVAYLVDADCERIINETEPRLFIAFQKERGSHKSDICRVIDLFQHGGYYLDNDLFVENVPNFPEHVSFSTVLENGQERFFQAFTAVSPQHPIMQEAIDLMVSHYVDGLDPRQIGYAKMNMGTWTVREAHKRAVAQDPKLSHQLHFLQEMNLEDHNKWDLGVVPDKNWRHYNNVVVDLQSNVLCFWSRLGMDLKKRQGWK